MSQYLSRCCRTDLNNLSQRKIGSLLVEQRSRMKNLKDVRPMNLESFCCVPAPRRIGWALSSSLSVAREAFLSSKKTLLPHKFGWLTNPNENTYQIPSILALFMENNH